MILTTVSGSLKSSSPYITSIAIVQASPDAQSALGQPIEAAGFVISGQISVTVAGGHADLTYSVEGPKGTGEVHAVADRRGGEWHFSTLQLKVDSTDESIDLLPAKLQ